LPPAQFLPFDPLPYKPTLANHCIPPLHFKSRQRGTKRSVQPYRNTLEQNKQSLMAGPASPGGEGPTFAPPPLPAGWIAQWDAASKKYYFVQLSTGASQWETPTEAAPVGGASDTPGPQAKHPYGVPGRVDGAEIIVHPDGSQTARYPDGRLEPVHPREDGSTADGTRGVGGNGSTDRGLGVGTQFP
jgi:hypothetical protein